MTRGVAVLVLAGALRAQLGPPAVNADSAIVQDFEKRVSAYSQMRKSLESRLPPLKATASPERISHYENELGRAIRAARRGAKPGDIFTPEISVEIRRLITIAMQPGDAENIRQSLRHAEPIQFHLNVNDSYPPGVPLQSTPPSLLQNLPPLPPEVEYRITGRDLVLLDAKANLVIDFVPGVFS